LDSFDHYENFPDRFEAAYRLELEAFFKALRENRAPSPGPEDALEFGWVLAINKQHRDDQRDPWSD
jgi:hypothetical protein